MNRPPIIVEVNPEVAGTITAAAAAAHPRETGGVLLGWWASGRIVARHAVEVTDPEATAHSWTRDQPRAQSALDTALTEYQHSWLGYVGDWHTHSTASGPSDQDLISIRRASRQYDQPLVLLVHRVDGCLDHVVAHRGRGLLSTCSRTSTPEGSDQ